MGETGILDNILVKLPINDFISTKENKVANFTIPAKILEGHPLKDFDYILIVKRKDEGKK